ncbi:hypothetical protein XFF6166_250002 [Xanthomonas citri pv. fuscans]|nr:hypothetical protein XACS584_1820004 [Xanthomonas citri pv. citri]SON77981.1 hypothetical protein XFF6166_250002 [Xanthomonas citri pv. fuscans]CEH58102.1 hypothetical protein XACS582_13090005 [Xanthomonas citri pv. citri]CEH99335.1 hypothetical protein XACS581_2430005 [Xanthomonas citri pv. citri]SON98990.1 hypothetical protein XFF6960_110019 [Xanthomonas citri pv. fuscans]
MRWRLEMRDGFFWGSGLQPRDAALHRGRIVTTISVLETISENYHEHYRRYLRPRPHRHRHQGTCR